MKKCLEIVGIQIIISIAMTMIIGGVALLMNDEIRGIYWVVAMIIAVASSYLFLSKEKRATKFIVVNILFLAVTFTTLYLSGKVYDTSWDGQTYHKEAIIVLKEGWNPIYDEERPDYAGEERTAYKINLWVNHYAKGNWYFGASLYDLFENIKLSKSYNSLFVISLLFISYSFFANRLRWYWAILLSLTITLNPIMISQLMTNYNDGEIGILFSLILLLAMKYHEKQEKKDYLIIGMLLIIMASVKFTALAYAMLIAATPFAIVIYKHIFEEKNKNIKQLIVRLIKMKELKTYVMAIIIGVVVVGAGSYMKNTIDHGHPFYPLSGEGKVDIMSYNTPLAIQDKPLYEQWYMATFGEMTNNRNKEEVSLKFPLSIQEGEESYLASVDLRIGGFGPFFGFVVIMTMLAIVGWSSSIFKRENKVELIVIVLILVSIVINPEMWWARYVPQLWLIPILTMYMLLKEKNKKKTSWVLIVSIVMIINSSLMLNGSIKKNYAETSMINEQMQMLRDYEGEIGVKYDTMRSSRTWLEQHNIEYKEVNKCENPITISTSTTKICVLEKKDYQEIKVKNHEIFEKYMKKEEKKES